MWACAGSRDRMARVRTYTTPRVVRAQIRTDAPFYLLLKHIIQSGNCTSFLSYYVNDIKLRFDMTTIIKIKYAECLSKNDDVGCLEIISTERELLVNVNCPIRMVLDYIRKVACLNGEFDLCDEVNCQLKNVSLYEPCTRAIDILQPDLTYFIITFERDENGQMINFTPLLTGKAAERYCENLSKIRRSSRKISSSKSVNKKHSNTKI